MGITSTALMIGFAALSALSPQAGDGSIQETAVVINGVMYRIEKSAGDGVETRLYDDGQQVYMADELREIIAAQPPHVLTDAAAAAVAGAGAEEMLDLVVVLRDQPAGPISRVEWAAVTDEKAAITGQIQAISRRYLPQGPLTPAQERAFSPGAMTPLDQAAKAAWAQRLDDLTRDTRIRIYEQVATAVAPSQNAVAATVAQLGGQVVNQTVVMNLLMVRVPAGQVGALAADPLIAAIDINHAGAPELDNHRISLGLTTGFWANGITGGVHDVGVLDTGVQQSHPALNSHRFLSNMGPNDTESHGTGMAGILASTSTTYPGMAFGCDTIVVARAGDIFTSMPGMDYIAGTGEPENVNYSFGNGTANDTDYGPTDQFFDGVIDTFGFMVSKSTGNGGFGTTRITHPAPAYNLMASANMDDMNNLNRAVHRITSSSSRGPTLLGRKKPDITAPGNNSMSTHPSGGFANIGGTSSASPHTGGGVVLLYDMGVTDVTACKAILLNTADAMEDNNTSSTADDTYVDGSNWNARYGWGYLNLGQAYLHGLDYFIDSVPDEPEEADYRLYVGQMFANEKATLTWRRHVAYNGSTFPTQIEGLSDLDLFAYRESDGGLLVDSTSPIDNVEQLHVGEDGVVVLKVEAAGQFDPEIAAQEFAIATQEGFQAAAGPVFAARVTHFPCVDPSEEFELRVRIANTGDLAAHSVSVELSGVRVVSGDNPQSVDSIPAGGAAEAVWMVEAAGAPGFHHVSAAVASASYGEEFDADLSGWYRVGGCSAADVNCDGRVDAFDIDAFIGQLPPSQPGCATCVGDINGDGTLDAFDIEPFIECLLGQP